MQKGLISGGTAGLKTALEGKSSFREGVMIRLQVIAVFILCSVVSFKVMGPVVIWLGASQEVEIAFVFGFFLLSFIGVVGWTFYLDVKNMYKREKPTAMTDDLFSDGDME